MVVSSRIEFQNRIIDYGSQSITLSFDYLGCPGAVSCMKWTPDGTALVMAWQRGGFSIWSTFGAMIMCSLCWDYGPLVSNFQGNIHKTQSKQMKVEFSVGYTALKVR